MIKYKYEINDAFALKNGNSNLELNLVVYSSKLKLVTLTCPIDEKGNTINGSNLGVSVFDLTSKNTLTDLSQQQFYKLPTCKYGQIGSQVIYGEDSYYLLGVTKVNIGSMTLEKPFLIDPTQVIELVVDGVNAGLDAYRINSDLQYLLLTNKNIIKIPLEGDKNMVIFESKELSTPKRQFDTILPVTSSTPASGLNQLLPEARNVVGDSSLELTEKESFDATLIGVGFNTLGVAFSMYGKRDKGAISFQLFFKNFLKRYKSSELFAIGEGDKLFPDWELKTDSKYPIGSGLIKKGGNEYRILGKVIDYTKFYEKYTKFYETNLNTKFGQYSNSDFALGDKGTYFLLHPSIFQGNNVFYKEDANDTFLLVGKFPLIGTKGSGIFSISEKEVNTLQYPILTRKEMDKMAFLSLDYFKSNNYSFFQRVSGLSSSITYYTPSVLPLLSDKRLASVQEFYFKDISNNGVQTNSVSQLMGYFDTMALSEIGNKNPKLEQKINDLISVAVNKFIPEQKKSTSFNPIEFLMLEDLGGLFTFYKDSSSYDVKGIQSIIFKIDDKDTYAIKFFNPEGKLGAIDSLEIQLIVDVYKSLMESIMMQIYDESYYNYSRDTQQQSSKIFIKFKDKDLLINNYKLFLKFIVRNNRLFNYEKINFQHTFNTFFESNFFAKKIFKNTTNKRPFRFEYSIYFEKNTWDRNNYLDLNSSIFYLKLQIPKTISQTDIDFIKNEYLNMVDLIIDEYETFQKFNQLLDLLPILQYYELLNDAMGEESSIENLKYDVRFREWLLQSSIFDAFTLNDVLKLKLFASKLLDSINTICELDIKEEFKINNLTFNNYTLQPQDLISILGLRYDTKFNQELYDKNKDSISYGKLSSSISLYYQIFLYLPDVYFGALEKLIKECTKIECLKNIFNGTTTCHEEFLNIFGNPSSSIVEPVVDEPIIEETTLEELSLDEVLQQTANEDIELVKKYGDSVIISTKFGALKLKYSNDIFEIRGDEWNGKNYVLLFEGDENGAKEFLKTAYVVVEGEDYDSSIEDEIVEVVEPPLDSEDDFDWDSLDPDNLDEILGDDINLDNIEI
jgi:hypothetical protein